MNRNVKCTKIWLDDLLINESTCVHFENMTDDPLMCAFGKEVSPVTVKDLYELIDTRIAPPRDKRVDTLLSKNLGFKEIPCIEDLVTITKGMLVEDFFWFYEPKRDDPEPDYNELRAKLGIWTGDILPLSELRDIIFGTDVYGISSLVTRASQPKWVYHGWFIKRDIWGYEAMAEVLVSVLARYTKGITCLDYVLLPTIDGRGVCASPIYTDSLCMEFVSFWDIITKSGRITELPLAVKNHGEDLLNKVIQIISEETGMDMSKYIHKMLMWDALILNTDRHYNNMAVRRNNTGQYTVMPFYDHGLALLSGYSMNEIGNIRARIYTDSFSRLAKLAGQEAILKIDMLGFCEHLDRMHRYYKDKEGYYATIFEEVRQVLITRLLDTKGVMWEATGREAYTINTSHYLEWQLSNGFNAGDYRKQVEKFHEELDRFDANTCLTNNLDDMAYGRHVKKDTGGKEE